MNKASLALSFALAAAAVACGGNAAKAPPAAPETRLTSSEVKPQPGVAVSDDIAKACDIKGTVQEAPKFDFDSSDLTAQERDVLAAVARCVTTGPLKGRALQLVGHADPRGEAEYNLGLGARRAHTVQSYLTQLGIAADKLGESSRGELDATGKDDAGYRLDRRVDVKLAR